MPRRKRTVIPGLAHHVTQRGGRRQNVFFQDTDRILYLNLLKENAERYGVQILSYCLMTNHVHHLLVPLEVDSLRRTLQFTHKRYADHVNAREGWTGHLWQQRFYSSPVDHEYFWITIRYILRNPVEAGMVKHASEYRWSTAPGHCKLAEDPYLTKQQEFVRQLHNRQDWHAWLADSDSIEEISLLRNRTSRDLPTGGKGFLDCLEANYGVIAHPPKLGRPRKKG